MNIIYHHRTQGTGAEGVHISQIVKNLRILGHNVDVVCPSGNDPLKTAGNNPFQKKEGTWKVKLMHHISRSAPQWFFEWMEMLYNGHVRPKLKTLIRQKKIGLMTFMICSLFVWCQS